ncbi:tRNA (N6-threonylcarbamoyladenosine(37)-N6)-methyltransferase TrmO [Methanorbis furvi]|uniref:Ribonuclease H n=1 Tax=Methanorbis furvi TaxID=3028299 RepID=A0AAE4MDX6_9EURY|nr:Ribonuclease H [Methanocorpusculaceae archaeon Ag1]
MDCLTIYTDGASRGNPGEAAAAWLILRGTDVLESDVLVLGKQTNNVAEYTALIHAIRSAKKFAEPKTTELIIYSDSELMISQMNGTYKVRSASLQPLHQEAKESASAFAKVTYHHVPRENPYIGSCDWLCNNALDKRSAADLIDDLRKGREPIECKPIGVVHSPFKERGSAPNQGRNTQEISRIEIFPEYRDGLTGLSAGNAVFILCWFDRSERDILQVVPHGRKELTGVFATRAPVRPNPISLTLVTIESIEGTTLTVRGLEAFDNTPVLDIKPYHAGIDTPENE